MSAKHPEEVRLPPVDRPKPKEKVSQAFATGARRTRTVTGNDANRRSRSHPMKG